jgi:hypothetical protein
MESPPGEHDVGVVEEPVDVASAMVLGMNSSNPDGWRFEDDRATERRS